jgi:hypothetical protein
MRILSKLKQGAKTINRTVCITAVLIKKNQIMPILNRSV